MCRRAARARLRGMTPLVLIPGYMLDDALWDGMLPYLPPELPLHFASLAEGDSIAAMAQADIRQLRNFMISPIID